MLSASLPTWPGRIQCFLRKAAFRAVDRGKFLPNLEEGTSEAKVEVSIVYCSGRTW